MRFRPGAAPGVLGVPAWILRDQRVQLGWTERTLHRRCLDGFGYGPSVLRRILRFRMTLRLAQTGVSLAATAARTGYADQAHLAREGRALAGVSLGQLIGAR